MSCSFAVSVLCDLRGLRVRKPILVLQQCSQVQERLGSYDKLAATNRCGAEFLLLLTQSHLRLSVNGFKQQHQRCAMW